MNAQPIPAAVAEALGITVAEAEQLLARDAVSQSKATLARLEADLTLLRREEANRAQAAAQAATVRTTEQPSDDSDVAFLHLSHRAMALTDATVNGPAVVLSNFAVSYLEQATYSAMPATWSRRHTRELRELSLLVVPDLLTRDPLAAILDAIGSPLQLAGGRERHEFECANDHVVAVQHMTALLHATRDRAQLERWLEAAPHAVGIRERLSALFGISSREGYTTAANGMGLKGI